MMEQINILIEGFKDDLAQKRYLRFILKVLFVGTAWLGGMILLVLLGFKIYDFVVANWEFLFWASGGTFTLIYLIKEHYLDKQKARMSLQEQERLLQEEADSKIIERNYRLLRNTLFEVTSYISDVLHVKKPTIETELDSPNHIVRKLNFVLYQFILYPLNASGVDTEVMKKVLQQEYARRLDAQCFSGIGQSYYFYEGQAEPIISVYEVSSNGAYLTVSLAIADENYCRHIRHGISANLLHQAEQIRNLSDRDF